MFSKKLEHRIEIMVISFCCSIFLISCGGGGGGGGSAPSVAASAPTTAITSGNAVQVSSEVLAASSVVSENAQDTAQSVTGAVSTVQARNMGIVDLIIWQVEKNQELETVLLPDQQIVGAVYNNALACDFGGNVSGSWNDVDNNSALSSGDSFTFTYNNCRMESNGTLGTISGSMSMHFNAFSAGDGINGSFDVSVTLNNLVLILPGDTETVHGDMRLSANFSIQSLAFTATGKSLSYVDGSNVSRTLANYSMTFSTPDALLTWSYRFNGKLTCSQTLGGTISFQTIVPFSGSSTDYADSGELEVTGAIPAGAQYNSSLYITVRSNTEVQLDIDADGDGTYEDTRVVGWNQLTL